MKKIVTAMFFVSFLIVGSIHAQDRSPVGISPAGDTGIARVGTVCPTFSWTAVDWAASYRLEVFVAEENPDLKYERMASRAYPMLVKEIRGAATSWTPTNDERLGADGIYVWFVQALDEYGVGVWSEGRMFRIETGAGFVAIEEAVTSTLEEHGIDKGVISQVKERIDEAAQNIGGTLLAGDIPVSVQGVEGTYITKYGYLAGADTTETYAYDTFIGVSAGESNTTGTYNTFLGSFAGHYGTTGNYTTSLGAYAGMDNNADANVFVGYGAGRDNASGINNTIVGTGANFYNDAGSHNSIFGRDAGYNNEASSNTFFGTQSGISNTTGYENIFIGRQAGFTNTTGVRNVFIGSYAGYFNLDAHHGTFLGHYAGYKNTTGEFNTFLGSWSGRENTTGEHNTFVGYGSGDSNTTADYNCFLGYFSGQANTIGLCNTFLGHQSGYNTVEGMHNTFVGNNSGYQNINANFNTIVGSNAGLDMTGSNNTYIGTSAGREATGSANVFIGNDAGYYETGSNRLFIDNSNTSSPLIWGDFGNDILAVNGKMCIGTTSSIYAMELETTGENAAFVAQRTDGATNYINATASFGNFGTVTNHPLRLAVNSVWRMRLDSDNSLTMANGAMCTAGGTWQNYSKREAKENIHDLTTDEAMDTLKGLVAVKYNYKVDKEEKHVGFIAEDVPELVASKDRDGISAMDIVAVLTKVVQEQQRLAEEQQKTISELQKQIDELKSREK